LKTPNYKIVGRDREIFFDLLWFGYLTQSQIDFVYFPETKDRRACQKRMQKLVAMGLVKSHENPTPATHNPQATRSDYVFYLSSQGFKYLQECQEIPEGLRPPEKSAGAAKFDHRMKTNWFWFYLQRAAEGANIDTSSFYTDTHKQVLNGRMQARIAFGSEGVEVEPDGAFYLERDGKRHLCLLEIDRNNNKLTDKFSNYRRAGTGFQEPFQELFDTEFKNYRTLIVTTDDQIIEIAQKALHEKEKPFYYFTTFYQVEKKNVLFDPIWRVGEEMKALGKRNSDRSFL
jgi:hypothetical protein